MESSTVLELTVRRLKWWQTAFLHIEDNLHILVIMFGELRKEREHREANKRVGARTLTDTARVDPKAHPWARHATQP